MHKVGQFRPSLASNRTSFGSASRVVSLLEHMRILTSGLFVTRAEEETIKAMDLAENAWEQSLAHKQLLEIRRLKREGTQKPEWTKSLKVPAAVLVLMTVFLSLMVIWK